MTTKRGSLAALMSDPVAAGDLPALPAPPAEVPALAPAVAAAVSAAGRRARAPSPRVSEDQTPDVRSPEVQTPEVRTPEVPKYRRLERKEVLLWPDQLGELSVSRRMLNRKRGGAGERITENTLIRVAVALLLSRSAELSGTTEDDLRRSLGLD